MILTRSPLRISLGGGGTDLPSYYRKFGGHLIAGAIDKYVYVAVNRPFQRGILLKYSKLEDVQAVSQIKHPIIREALKLLNLENPQIEISTVADIPSGTGLGSSGSFTTGLIKALYSFHRLPLHADELAALACEIEINKLFEPVGKQDQYISAFGGLTSFTFEKDGSVKQNPLLLSNETLYNLEDNLLLFFTGQSRSASKILRDQNIKSLEDDPLMLENLHHTKELGLQSLVALEKGDLETFAKLLHKHWMYKKARSIGTSNPRINQLYEVAIANGALGGKLVGAGGGGFLMFYASNKVKLRAAMQQSGLQEVRFRFDFDGTKVVTT
jgi:D-glycero-alpha-D-manno-heptose-7-phosphate kinase